MFQLCPISSQKRGVQGQFFEFMLVFASEPGVNFES